MELSCYCVDLFVKNIFLVQFPFLIITFAHMSAIVVKIINQSSNPLPSYATNGAAGMDIRANLPQQLTLQPMERFLVPTGLYIELPDGYEAQIRPRSGLAIKQGITCLNSPGTVDSDYRGELKIILINFGNEAAIINNGDRIAQMVIAATQKATLVLVEQLNDSVRNEGGFGHTGIS